MTIVFALVLTGGFAAGFIYFLLKCPSSSVTWVIMLPLFIAFAVISVLSILQAFFGYCSFDDETGIEFSYGFARPIKVSLFALESFYTYTDGINISYKTQKGGMDCTKKIKVPIEFEHLQLLNEWLDLHAENQYAKEVTGSVREFSEAHSELSDEKKEALFKRIHLVAKILNWTGIAIAVMLFASTFAGKTYMRAALIVCAAYPLVMLLVMKFSKGAFRLNVKETDVNPSLYSAFMWCSISLALIGISLLDQIYSIPRMIFTSALVTLLVMGLYWLCSCDAEKNEPSMSKLSTKLLTILSLFVILYFYGFGLTIDADIMFDFSKSEVYEATVSDMHIVEGKHTDYYIDVFPWIDDSAEHKEISVGKSLYENLSTGNAVIIKLHQGLFYIPWYSVVKAEE